MGYLSNNVLQVVRELRLPAKVNISIWFTHHHLTLFRGNRTIYPVLKKELFHFRFKRSRCGVHRSRTNLSCLRTISLKFKTIATFCPIIYWHSSVPLKVQPIQDVGGYADEQCHSHRFHPLMLHILRGLKSLSSHLQELGLPLRGLTFN